VRVVLPRLVDEPELEPANAMLSIGDQVSALVGPAVAGVLVGLVGAPPVLLLDAASFLAMATLVRSLPDTPAPAAAPPPARGSAGRLLLRGPTVRTVLALTLIYFLAYGPLEPALPLYSRDVLHAGPGGYGLLWSAFGAGALLGLATIPVVSRLRPGIALAGNALLWGGDPSAPGRHHQYRPGGPRPCRWRAGLGALHHPGSVPAATSRPSLPARLVFGVRRAVTAAAVPLGAAAGGLLLDHAAPSQIIGLSAATCILAGAVALCSPALHRLPTRPTSPPAA